MGIALVYREAWGGKSAFGTIGYCTTTMIGINSSLICGTPWVCAKSISNNLQVDVHLSVNRRGQSSRRRGCCSCSSCSFQQKRLNSDCYYRSRCRASLIPCQILVIRIPSRDRIAAGAYRIPHRQGLVSATAGKHTSPNRARLNGAWSRHCSANHPVIDLLVGNSIRVYCTARGSPLTVVPGVPILSRDSGCPIQ